MGVMDARHCHASVQVDHVSIWSYDAFTASFITDIDESLASDGYCTHPRLRRFNGVNSTSSNDNIREIRCCRRLGGQRGKNERHTASQHS